MTDHDFLTEDDLIEQRELMDYSSKTLSNQDIANSHDYPIVVSYKLADIGTTEYGFHQSFTKEDTEAYFRIMRRFAKTTLNQLIDSKDRHTLHLYRTDLRGNLRKELKRLCPHGLDVSSATIYHFALYQKKNTTACRETGCRSPRVYFILGSCGTIYPVFFDPFHELNPMKSVL